MKKEINYTQTQFNRDIDQLAIAVSVYAVKDIYGIPRGGLIPAVCLAHKTNLPLITDPKKITEQTLIVDDIVDSGKTITSLYKKYKIKLVAALIETTYHTIPKQVILLSATRKQSHRWILFWWERKHGQQI